MSVTSSMLSDKLFVIFICFLSLFKLSLELLTIKPLMRLLFRVSLSFVIALLQSSLCCSVLMNKIVRQSVCILMNCSLWECFITNLYDSNCEDWECFFSKLQVLCCCCCWSQSQLFQRLFSFLSHCQVCEVSLIHWQGLCLSVYEFTACFCTS